MTITTDSTTVKLTEQEAINEAEFGRNMSILHWRVINRLSRSDGDTTGIEDLDKTSGIASPGHAPGPDPVDADTLAQYV